MARFGMARQGLARQRRRDMERQGKALQGRQTFTLNEENMSSRSVKLALRRGVSIAGVKPGTVVSALEDIANSDKSKRLTAEKVLDASRPAKAPLHPAFEWNDEKAAENYRIHQARNVIRSVQVVNTQTGEKTPVWVYVPNSIGRGEYARTTVVVKSPDSFMLALSHLQKRVYEAAEAVEQLRRAARESGKDEDRLTQIGIAVHAMGVAQAALQSLH